RIGKATVSVPLTVIQEVAGVVTPALREKLGLTLREGFVTQWLWGFLAHLRRRGAVWHPELSNYARDGDGWALQRSQGHGEGMPWFADRAPRPGFLTLGHHRDFDRLAGSKRSTWFTRWAQATLGRETLLPERSTEDLYSLAIAALETRALVVRTTGPRGDSLA